MRMSALAALPAVASSALVLAAAVEPSTAATTPIPHANCGSLRAAGTTWWIGTVELPCARAKTVVARLAPLPVPKGAYPAVLRGLNCVGFERPKAKKSLGCVGIGCLSPSTGAILSAADARW